MSQGRQGQSQSSTSNQSHIARRQLKAIKSHGKRHSSTIVGNAVGIFPDRPLAGHTSAKKGKHGRSGHHGTDVPFVENMTISIDLEVKEAVASDDFLDKLRRLVGLGKVNRDFEVLATADKIIRALAKAKFKNVAVLELDDEELYYHPEEFYDIDAALERLINEIGGQPGKGERIYLQMRSTDFKKCTVEATISRVHMTWTHDILIKFHGTLPEEYFRRVINYLEDHLAIEDMVKNWSEA